MVRQVKMKTAVMMMILKEITNFSRSIYHGRWTDTKRKDRFNGEALRLIKMNNTHR